MEIKKFLNKKAKIFNIIYIVSFAVIETIFVFLKMWVLPLILGLFGFAFICMMDYISYRMYKAIENTNTKIINSKDKNAKVGYLSRKQYEDLMNGKGIITSEGMPITKNDVKEFNNDKGKQ